MAALNSVLTERRTGLNPEKRWTQTTLQPQRLHQQSSRKHLQGHSIYPSPTLVVASTTSAPFAKRNLRTSGLTRRKNGSGLTRCLCAIERIMDLASQRPRGIVKLRRGCLGARRNRSLESERRKRQFRRQRREICGCIEKVIAKYGTVVYGAGTYGAKGIYCEPRSGMLTGKG